MRLEYLFDIKNPCRVIKLSGLIPIFLMLILPAAYSQDMQHTLENFDLQLRFSSNIAKNGEQPLWNYSRAQGTIRPFTNGFTNQIDAGYHKSIKDRIDVSLGVTSLFRLTDNASIYLQQFYLESNTYFLRFKAGRREEMPDVPIPELSVGTFGINNQTTPLPEIKIEVPEFTHVPFTSEILWFKGQYAHAWLEEDRFVQNPYLHEKDFYLSLYKKGLPLRASAGLNHFAQWQGTHPEVGTLGKSLEDYYRVIFSKGAEATELQGEINNSQGNHLGYWDWRLSFPLEDLSTGFYWMYPFEDGSGLALATLGDGIYGYHLKNEGRLPDWFKGVVFEFVYTKNQTGPGYSDARGDEENYVDKHGDRLGGRDNYYNNYVYQSGWTYNSLNLGMPLMLTRQQHAEYLGEEAINERLAFTSNRIKAYHIGISGNVNSNTTIKVNASYTFHSGTYKDFDSAAGGDFRANPELRDNYVFYPALEQFYGHTKINYKPGQKYVINLALGWDTGDLYNSIGAVAGLKINI